MGKRDLNRKNGGRTGLSRALSKRGFCSRAQATKLIRTGCVRVNGRPVFDPEYPVHPWKAHIEVNRQTVHDAEKIYLMMNKPRGLVTSARDEKGRETVYSLLPATMPWLAPVGRLDKASEGLLLFSNDPEWGAHIVSPDTHVKKTYHVQIGTVANQALLGRLRAGIQDGGGLLRVESASVLRAGERNSWLEIHLEEGKNRHIRRMFAAMGVEVLRLLRIAIGPLKLGSLPKGSVRELTSDEVAELSGAGATKRA